MISTTPVSARARLSSIFLMRPLAMPLETIQPYSMSDGKCSAA